jgi:hypothetical protein
MVKSVLLVKNIFFALFLISIVIFSSGCRTTQSNNNDKNIWDMVEHFIDSDIKIESMQPLSIAPMNCSQAVALKIAGRQIGIYKYNTRWKKAQKRLKELDENGYVFILGKKFNVLVNGSFVLMDYNQNKEEGKIVKAFDSF